jgi:fluoroquinolone transport system permease protein
MGKLWFLFKGEVIRLWRYKITLFGLLVSGIWLLIIAIVSQQEANALLPQLLILDSGLMSIILLAAAYFYEKQEGTMKAVLVSPTSPALLLASKVMGALVGSLISLLLMWLAMMVIHQTTFPILPALIIIILTTVAHISIGYLLIYLSQDFMDLLLKYTLAVIILFTPTILVSLEIVDASWQWIAFFSPTYAGQRSLSHLWQPLSTTDLWFSWLSLAIYPLILFPLYILPKFRKEAIRA